jgi:hypothetical protein
MGGPPPFPPTPPRQDVANSLEELGAAGSMAHYFVKVRVRARVYIRVVIRDVPAYGLA